MAAPLRRQKSESASFHNDDTVMPTATGKELALEDRTAFGDELT